MTQRVEHCHASPKRHCSVAADPFGFRPHDHVAWSDDREGALDQLAVAAFSVAAQRNELMVLVSQDSDPRRLNALEGGEALIDAGALRLVEIEDVYNSNDLSSRLQVFDQMIDGALKSGYSGLCVVAENSMLAGGDDEQFASWIAWEAMVDRMLAERPVHGICFFDRRRVSSERIADLAALHPVVSSTTTTPDFQLFVEGDAVKVVGAVEAFSADQLARIITSAPHITQFVLDLSEAEFIDHRALLVLNRAGRAGSPVRLRGAKEIVRRLWELLDEPQSALEFC